MNNHLAGLPGVEQGVVVEYDRLPIKHDVLVYVQVVLGVEPEVYRQESRYQHCPHQQYPQEYVDHCHVYQVLTTASYHLFSLHAEARPVHGSGLG